jgi:hypothetical protein
MESVQSIRWGRRENPMLRHRMKRVLLTVLLVTVTTGHSLASISQPDVVYYGTALNGDSGNTVTITLSGSISPLASCTLGADRSYLLRVPMDDVGARISGTARQGDAAVIAVNGTAAPNGTIVIPRFGTSVNLELGARTPEQWAKDHPGDDGSGDMNRNGITDLAEYLAGGNPASCNWVPGSEAGWADTIVYHHKVLENCLKDAGEDGMSNLIRVARGSYAGNFSYVSGWQENYDLTLIGGMDPAGTGERTADPLFTILDGDTDSDGNGNGTVLVVDTNNSKSTGKVHLESLSFKNGKAPSGKYGGGIRALVYQGGMELVGNIVSGNSTDSVSGNTADSGGGVSVESSDSGSLLLVNNLFYGNSSGSGSAARIVSGAQGPITLLNNTIADNAATSTWDGRLLLIASTAAPVDLTNNIVTGASGGSGKDIYVNSSYNVIPLSITHNNFDTVNGLLVNAPGFAIDPSNIGDDPQFKAPLTGNYRLISTSTCIDKGTTHTGLPQWDIVGTARILNGLVDMGAYEFHSGVTNLNLSFAGNGSGSVVNTLPPFSCNSGCIQSLPDPTPLILSANPAEYSLFGGWSGCDSVNGNLCTLNLISDRTVVATFNRYTAHTARISGATPVYFPSLQGAYDSSTAGNEIEVWGIDLSENVVCGTAKDVTIRGGYDQPYLNRPGVTTLRSLAIGRGKVTVDGLVVK